MKSNWVTDERLILVTGEAKMEKYVVAYAKVVTDKENVILHGVYFGGLGDTFAEAEQIARHCVNSIRGGTILPRVVKINGKEQIIDAMYDATERFERITESMKEANRIIARTQNRG